MAKADKKVKLVKRVVVGPKGIWIKGKLHGIGETVELPLKSAKTFACYLEAPGVAAAKAAVAKAESEANEDADAEKAASDAEDKEEEELQANAGKEDDSGKGS